MYGNPQKGQAADEVVRLRREGGAWLRALREAAGLSQRDLSRCLDLEYYTFISQIESGKGRVPPNQYAAMAKALKVEPHDFARHMLRFYDPITHEMLFGSETRPFSPILVRNNDPKVSDLAKRLAKLERMVAIKPEPRT